jgi:hypothetical protein
MWVADCVDLREFVLLSTSEQLAGVDQSSSKPNPQSSKKCRRRRRNPPLTAVDGPPQILNWASSSSISLSSLNSGDPSPIFIMFDARETRKWPTRRNCVFVMHQEKSRKKVEQKSSGV